MIVNENTTFMYGRLAERFFTEVQIDNDMWVEISHVEKYPILDFVLISEGLPFQE